MGLSAEAGSLANFGKRRERVVGFLRGLVPLYEGLVSAAEFMT